MRTEETKKKISKRVKETKSYIDGSMWPTKGKTKYSIIEKLCLICGMSFETKDKKQERKFCSLKCSRKSPLVGGARPGSGRSKSGWYRGFYCGSTWELAFLIWSLDHGLAIQRCVEKFSYNFEGKVRTYLPDFKIGEFFIEIKGYNTEQNKAKISQFSEKLIVLYEEDLLHVFQYVKEKHGNDYLSLYEGNPHNKKTKKCLMCESPCSNMYCSKRCSIKANHKYRSVTPLGAAPSSSP